jgi:hypothetical protein
VGTKPSGFINGNEEEGPRFIELVSSGRNALRSIMYHC